MRLSVSWSSRSIGRMRTACASVGVMSRICRSMSAISTSDGFNLWEEQCCLCWCSNVLKKFCEVNQKALAWECTLKLSQPIHFLSSCAQHSLRFFGSGSVKTPFWNFFKSSHSLLHSCSASTSHQPNAYEDPVWGRVLHGKERFRYLFDRIVRSTKPLFAHRIAWGWPKRKDLQISETSTVKLIVAFCHSQNCALPKDTRNCLTIEF